MYNPRQRRSPRYHNPTHRASDAAHVPRADAEGRPPRCIALVDARFMGWLASADAPGARADAVPLNIDTLRALRRAMADAGLHNDLTRVYWYTDQASPLLIDDVVVRTVADAQVDGGASGARAMAADLARLAAHQAADVVLLASDDERLWAAVDDAQLHGLAVALLCDDSVSDFAQLQNDDPSWARLLAQADRRVVWLGTQGGAGRHAAGSGGGRTSLAEPEADREAIMAEITQWWADEPELQRIDLRDELNDARGIPQEVDRQLLLRLSRALGHPLSWPEKKIMRDGVRRTVLGDDYTPSRTGNTGGDDDASGPASTSPAAPAAGHPAADD